MNFRSFVGAEQLWLLKLAEMNKVLVQEVELKGLNLLLAEDRNVTRSVPHIHL